MRSCGPCGVATPMFSQRLIAQPNALVQLPHLRQHCTPPSRRIRFTEQARSRTIGCISRRRAAYQRRVACRHLVSEPAGRKASRVGHGSSSKYETLAAAVTCETEVKKSKFVATGWPIASASQALELVAEAGDAAASHNCYAYRLDSKGEFRSSDDGEPSGTAGRPILSAIEGEGLDAVCVLVTRYYGGSKLGAGGLVRAYGEAARECLRQGERVRVRPTAELRVQAAFQHIGALYAAADQHGAERLAEEYLDSGEVVLQLRVEQRLVAALNAALADATAGSVAAQPVD